MGNVFQDFLALIPREVNVIGTVQVVHADGSARVQLLDGGIVIAVGGNGYSVGSKVIVRGNAIISSAPDVPITNILI
jgi:hypothetical protein